MARRKVPSQVATGAETFSDSLVGRQITDGTSQLTNTNFALDSEVIQRDVKTFKTNQGLLFQAFGVQMQSCKSTLLQPKPSSYFAQRLHAV